MNYGLNYMGSKNTIANDIVQYMVSRHPDKSIFIDATAGGLSVSHLVLRETNLTVIANDLNKYFIDLYRHIVSTDKTQQSAVFDAMYTWYSREQVMDILKNMDAYPPWLVAFIITVWTFGGAGDGYLYGKDKEDEKRMLWDVIVNNKWDPKLAEFRKVFSLTRMPGNMDPAKLRIHILNQYSKFIGTPFQLENLSRSERLNQLFHDIRLNRKRISFSVNDYKIFVASLADDVLDNAIVYVDPPYEDTNEYVVQSIDYVEFWAWVQSLKDRVPVYVSSYKAPAHITLAWEQGKEMAFRSNDNRKIVREKLFYNDYADVQLQLFDLL